MAHRTDPRHGDDFGADDSRRWSPPGRLSDAKCLQRIGEALGAGTRFRDSWRRWIKVRPSTRLTDFTVPVILGGVFDKDEISSKPVHHQSSINASRRSINCRLSSAWLRGGRREKVKRNRHLPWFESSMRFLRTTNNRSTSVSRRLRQSRHDHVEVLRRRRMSSMFHLFRQVIMPGWAAIIGVGPAFHPSLGLMYITPVDQIAQRALANFQVIGEFRLGKPLVSENAQNPPLRPGEVQRCHPPISGQRATSPKRKPRLRSKSTCQFVHVSRANGPALISICTFLVLALTGRWQPREEYFVTQSTCQGHVCQ